MLRKLQVVFVVALCAGCSGGGGGSSAGGTLVYDASGFLGGKLSISGTVTLPKAASGGGGAQIGYVAEDAGGQPLGSYAASAGKVSGTQAKYRLTGLVSGSYRVTIRIDADGDNQLRQPGDFEGYYDGTVAAPIMDVNNAHAIDVGSSSVTGADFGLGIVGP